MSTPNVRCKLAFLSLNGSTKLQRPEFMWSNAINSGNATRVVLNTTVK